MRHITAGFTLVRDAFDRETKALANKNMSDVAVNIDADVEDTAVAAAAVQFAIVHVSRLLR